VPLVWDEDSGALEADTYGDLFAGGEADTWVFPVLASPVAKHRSGSRSSGARLLYPSLDPRHRSPGRRAQIASATLAAVALLAGAVTVWATPSRHDRLTAAGTRLSSDQTGASRAARTARHKTPQGTRPEATAPAPQPAASVSPSPSPSATPSASSGAASPSPSASPSSSVSPSPTASATPVASPSGSPPGSALVTLAPGVSQNPAAAGVESLLVSYFTAINARDFGSYANLFIPGLRQSLTAAGFASGYQSTTDSHAILVGISATGPGVAAVVTFTSQQNPNPSAGITACTNWEITLYLWQNGSGFLIGPPPAGYQAYQHACS
jgi:hypothetical protein